MGFGEWFTQSLAQGGHLTADFTGSDLGKHPRRGECCCLFNSSGFERYGRNNAYEESRGGQLSCTTPLQRANELRALNAQLKTTFGSQGGSLVFIKRPLFPAVGKQIWDLTVTEL